MSVTISGIPIVDLPDLGAVTDSSSVVGEHAGSGRFNAPAFRSYVTAGLPWISVKAYGAVGNGSTDDTAAINAALASGQAVYFPAGIYQVSGPLTVTAVGQVIWGVGEMSTTIRTSAATGDVLTISGTDLDIGHIGFTASVTRTAGAMINLGNSSQIRIHDFYMTAWFVGISIGTGGTAGGNSNYIEKGILLTTRASGYGVQCNAGVVCVLRDLLIEGNNTGGTQLSAGVIIGAFGDITLDHVETIWAGTGLQISPPAGAVAQAVMIVNSLFDTGSGWGINANANQAGAVIQLLQIDTCWVASNAAGGINLTTASTGVVQQTDIINTVSSNNTGHGLSIGPRVAYTRVMASSFGSNTASGVWVNPTTTNFQFIGNTMGASGEFLGNAVGITLNNGCDNFTVADNNLNANTSAQMNVGTLPVNMGGVTYWIKDNIGFATHRYGILITTAGPASFAVSHGLSLTPNLYEVRLTLGSAPGSATYFYPSAATATTFAIVFNVAPGAGVVVNWDIRILGN